MTDKDDRDDLLFLVLRPLSDDVPWPIRLRMALKTLLRRDRLRCVGLAQLRRVEDEAKR
jgi:hypothetical protein